MDGRGGSASVARRCVPTLAAGQGKRDGRIEDLRVAVAIENATRSNVELVIAEDKWI